MTAGLGLARPAIWYTDPARWPLERARLFGRTWQYAAPLAQVQVPGSYAAIDVAGKPVLITRDLDGQLHAFHNVCRHQEAAVAHGVGVCRVLMCANHGWMYGLDGGFLPTPAMEAVPGFNRADFGLWPVRVEAWGPLVLVNLSPDGPPLAEALGHLAAGLALPSFSGLRRAGRRTYSLNANWKVCLGQRLARGQLSSGPAADRGQPSPVRPAPMRLKPVDGASDSFWLFPNLILHVYSDGLRLSLNAPLSHARTRIICEWYAAEPGAESDRPDGLACSDEEQREMLAACEAEWHRLQAGAADQDGFAAGATGVRHFETLLAGFLGEAA